ncbi:MAG TPA: cyclic nucleotide-binding domain-containing protein [Bryobacteraceae bacterium]|nr:cyclic nucleotide-binding domain-containing protein [Bryobacteraceae bacterium]
MISTQEFIQLTKEQDLLKAFGPQHLERLASLAEEVDFHRDQIVFHEEEHHGKFYLILDGSVGLEIMTARHPVLLQTLHAGDAMAWSSLTNGGSGAHFEARALTSTRALAFDGAKLREACDADPAFGYRMMKALLSLVTERLDITRMQLLDMYAMPGAVRA